jgi:hypothetical protein
LTGLDNWTASNAAYSAGDGDEHYGVAVLATGGGYVEQQFSVPHSRGYTFHIAVKAVGAPLGAGEATARVRDGDGNTLFTVNLVEATGDAWEETTYTWGLPAGETLTLRLTNVTAAGDVRLDDVWLWWVPVDRAGLAARVHAKLGSLATAQSLSTTPSGTLTEGDYTYAVDAGLRAAGAIDPETDLPDVRWLDSSLLDTALDAIEKEMLEMLQRTYAVKVDTQVGSRRESYSQVAKALGELTGAGGQGAGAGKVVVRKLHHKAEDFEFD